MNVMSAVVLFCSIWAIVLFMVLPHGLVSQAEAGEVEPGTPASAPSDAMIVRKMLVTTAIASVVFAAAFSVIQFHLVTLDDIPFLTPPSAR